MNARHESTEQADVQADGRECIEQRLDVLTARLSGPLPTGDRLPLLREYNNLTDEIRRLAQ